MAGENEDTRHPANLLGTMRKNKRDKAQLTRYLRLTWRTHPPGHR